TSFILIPPALRAPLRRRPQVIIALGTMPDLSPMPILEKSPNPNRRQDRKEQSGRPIGDDDEPIVHRNPAGIVRRKGGVDVVLPNVTEKAFHFYRVTRHAPIPDGTVSKSIGLPRKRTWGAPGIELSNDVQVAQQRWNLVVIVRFR